MRIDKLLSNSGFGSRKDVKKMLKDRIVTVNGEIITDGKVQVNPEVDEIRVQNERVDYREFIYLMMNKPPGVISATEDTEERTVIDLLSPEDANYDPFPVGRLDKNTVGLLLLTNDGKLAHRLLSPKKHVEKTYFAVVNDRVTEEDILQFEKGVRLDDGYVTEPAKLRIEKSGDRRSDVLLTITEGKFHQVKRMFEAVGKKVVYLKRLSIGSISLDEGLQEGKYRPLTDEEIEKLKRDANVK